MEKKEGGRRVVGGGWLFFEACLCVCLGRFVSERVGLRHRLCVVRVLRRFELFREKQILGGDEYSRGCVCMELCCVVVFL